MSASGYIFLTVFIAGTFGSLPVPFLDFYVPGELISGPDVSYMFLPEIESNDEVKGDVPGVVSGPETPEIPLPPQSPQSYQCTESKFLQCVDCKSFAVSSITFY